MVCSTSLRKQLIHALAVSGVAQVGNEASYVLEARIVSQESETIGALDGEDAEERMRWKVEVALRDAKSGEAVFGPTEIEASIDYDYLSGKELAHAGEISSFSLGQLGIRTEAKRAATPGMEAEVARKIVDLLFRSWYIE